MKYISLLALTFVWGGCVNATTEVPSYHDVLTSEKKALSLVECFADKESWLSYVQGLVSYYNDIYTKRLEEKFVNYETSRVVVLQRMNISYVFAKQLGEAKVASHRYEEEESLHTLEMALRIAMSYILKAIP